MAFSGEAFAGALDFGGALAFGGGVSTLAFAARPLLGLGVGSFTGDSVSSVFFAGVALDGTSAFFTPLVFLAEVTFGEALIEDSFSEYSPTF